MVVEVDRQKYLKCVQRNKRELRMEHQDLKVVYSKQSLY